MMLIRYLPLSISVVYSYMINGMNGVLMEKITLVDDLTMFVVGALMACFQKMILLLYQPWLIGDTLKTKYRVKVDDKNREWSVENIAKEN